MEKYVITIINLSTGTKQYIERDQTNIDETIQKELGGWGQLRSSGNADRDLDDINYQLCGFTKDHTKMYSILCYKGED